MRWIVVVCLAMVASSCGAGTPEDLSGEPSPQQLPAAEEQVPDPAAGRDDAASSVAPPLAASVPERPSFLVVGHRGARGLRPESTTPAFEAALDMLVDAVEMDLQITGDDVVVVWHGTHLTSVHCRLPAGGAGSGADELEIAASSWVELADLSCDKNPNPDRFPDQLPEPGVLTGDDYTLVSLPDVLAFVDSYSASRLKSVDQRRAAEELLVYVEVKPLGSPQAVLDGAIETIQLLDAEHRVTLRSRDPALLGEASQRLPDTRLGLITLQQIEPDRGALALVDVWSPHIGDVDQDAVALAEEAGIELIPWGANDEATISLALELGVDGVITDRPDLALALRPGPEAERASG